jgi:hypothetical protein
MARHGTPTQSLYFFLAVLETDIITCYCSPLGADALTLDVFHSISFLSNQYYPTAFETEFVSSTPSFGLQQAKKNRKHLSFQNTLENGSIYHVARPLAVTRPWEGRGVAAAAAAAAAAAPPPPPPPPPPPACVSFCSCPPAHKRTHRHCPASF